MKINVPSSLRTISKVVFLLMIPIGFAYAFTFLFPIPAFSLKGEGVVNYLLSLNYFAPLIYLFLQAVSVLIIPIPSIILATSAGVVFGFWLAIPLTTLAWIIGTSINFYIARKLGRPFLKKILKNKELVSVDQFAERIGWKLIFISWFIPGGTADIAGYAAGITEMKYSKYFFPALTSAFLLAILASLAGAAYKINPIFTAIFTFGAVLGIAFGAKIIIILTLIKKFLLKKKS
jgi:uncharacterized membrane protein YdjX (TVP38/TMEM64 family)